MKKKYKGQYLILSTKFMIFEKTMPSIGLPKIEARWQVLNCSAVSKEASNRVDVNWQNV